MRLSLHVGTLFDQLTAGKRREAHILIRADRKPWGSWPGRSTLCQHAALVGMEASVGAHHLNRNLMALGGCAGFATTYAEGASISQVVAPSLLAGRFRFAAAPKIVQNHSVFANLQ